MAFSSHLEGKHPTRKIEQYPLVKRSILKALLPAEVIPVSLPPVGQ
jgi:hypothetical protein